MGATGALNEDIYYLATLKRGQETLNIRKWRELFSEETSLTFLIPIIHT